jgi:hypothetical protein
MCIYCGTDKYRKIYENHHGPIPKDEEGQSFEIHHIDGDHSNNNPTNLVAVTLQEHYDIHYSQKDYGACFLIATQRMNKTPKEISELARKAALKRVDAGTHPFLGGEVAKKTQQRRVAEGQHHFLGGAIQHFRVKNGTHNFLSGKIQRESNHKRLENGTHHILKLSKTRIENGTHNFLGKTNPALTSWICEYCGKEGKGKGNYVRYHGNKCKPKN